MNENANEINTYFIIIGHSLSEKIQSMHSNSVFKFTAVNEECIDRIMKNLNQNLAQAMTTFQISLLNTPELLQLSL